MSRCVKGALLLCAALALAASGVQAALTWDFEDGMQG